MDEEISIINSNTRNEKVRNFFVKNKSKIILISLAIIIVLIAAYSFDKYKTNQKIEISNKFNSTTLMHSDKNKESTIKNLVEIINKKDPTYSPLSLYFILDKKLISDRNKINEYFDLLIENTPLDKEINNLVIYKKALFNADQAQESDLLNILNPLINSESVWRSHALYLMAEFFYSRESKAKIERIFQSNNQFRKPQFRY
jgi:hypothetical protein